MLYLLLCLRIIWLKHPHKPAPTVVARRRQQHKNPYANVNENVTRLYQQVMNIPLVLIWFRRFTKTCCLDFNGLFAYFVVDQYYIYQQELVSSVLTALKIIDASFKFQKCWSWFSLLVFIYITYIIFVKMLINVGCWLCVYVCVCFFCYCEFVARVCVRACVNSLFFRLCFCTDTYSLYSK